MAASKPSLPPPVFVDPQPRLVLILLDFRRRRNGPSCPAGKRPSSSWLSVPANLRRLIVLHAWLDLKCLPNKFRRLMPEHGLCAWTRGSRPSSGNVNSRDPRLQLPPYPATRPTLLVPAMQTPCPPAEPPTRSKARGWKPRGGSTSSGTSQCLGPPHLYLSPSSSLSPTSPFGTLPEPSAPSPGQVLFNSEDESDVVFLVGPEPNSWRIPGHSFILRNKPAFLQAVLGSDRPSSDLLGGCHRTLSPPGSGNLENVAVGSASSRRPCIVVKITDIQPDVFEHLLRFIYTHEVALSSVQAALRLLQAANTYHLYDLSVACLTYLLQHTSKHNVLEVLRCVQPRRPASGQQDYHDSDNLLNELVLRCFDLIDGHGDFILRSEAFDTLDLDSVIEIVSRETLSVGRELAVFEAEVRWACQACKRQRKELTPENKRAVLGKAFSQVRYLRMTEEEFLRGPVAAGVFSDEEKDALLGRIRGDTSRPLPPHLNGWKMGAKRRSKKGAGSSGDSGKQKVSESRSSEDFPAGSTGSHGTSTNQKKSGEKKKKSTPVKVLHRIGGILIYVVQLLD